MAFQITDENFDSTVNQGITVVDFWAEWCGPCKKISPIVDKLAEEYEGKVLIGKVDVEENIDTCEKLEIRNIPTLLFYKNGELVDKVVGAIAESDLRKKIDNLL